MTHVAKSIASQTYARPRAKTPFLATWFTFNDKSEVEKKTYVVPESRPFLVCSWRLYRCQPAATGRRGV